MARKVRLASNERQAVGHVVNARCSHCEGKMTVSASWEHGGDKAVYDGSFDAIVYGKCGECGFTDFYLFKKPVVRKGRVHVYVGRNAGGQVEYQHDELAKVVGYQVGTARMLIDYSISPQAVAFVNGMEVPMYYKLQDGDTLEYLTDVRYEVE